MDNFKNVMIDIETLDTLPSAVILSVAVVPFDLESGLCGSAICWTIQLKSSLFAKRTISADTMLWWLSQDVGVMDAALKGDRLFQSVMYDLSMFFAGLDPEVIVWANSPSFDLVILKDAFKTCGLEWPLPYYNERDVRTYIKTLPDFVSKVPVPDRQHDPVVDCVYQIEKVHEVYTWMNEFKINGKLIHCAGESL